MGRFEILDGERGRVLRVTGELPPGFQGERQGEAWLCPCDAANAAALRATLPWTAPAPVGLRKSLGCGDRLGLATPGHIRAIRQSDMVGVFAQQSIREMRRCGRSAQEVVDDATWGVLRMNWRGGYGSDADHLKQIADIDECVAAGFTGFTLDPNEHVDNAAQGDEEATLRHKFAGLPWERLETSAAEMRRLYLGNSPGGPIEEETLLRAASKYSRAIAHVATLARHIVAHFGAAPFDLEISVDETDTPTSPAEHFFLAAELRRLGICFEGLAPRFVGDFEKGVDYIGGLEKFGRDYAAHARIAREQGPYKLSIHTGSDKFRIYPLIARHSGEYLHLKTAGTSWLEALRVIARRDVPLFRDILALARERFPSDRASYHISGRLDRMPAAPTDAELPALLEQFDARQVLHVTFGSALDRFRAPIMHALRRHAADYEAALEKHFARHIAPFQGGTTT